MKRSRSSSMLMYEQLDPLAVALLALGGGGVPAHEVCSAAAPADPTQHEEGRSNTQQVDQAQHLKQQSSSRSRRDYVWRGPHRQELTQHKKQQQQLSLLHNLDAAEGHSSRRSSATQGMPSDDDEVAQQEQHQQQHQQPQHKFKRQPKKQQQQHRDSGKEWAALTTWLRMNLHNPRTHKRVILFLGQQDPATGHWVFSLNPQVSWHELPLETKLRLKTLLVEAEQSYLQKYPGHSPHEWGSKLQKYTPPGSSEAAEVSLYEVVTGLHRIYLQHEGPTATNNNVGQLQTASQQLGAGAMQQQQHMHQLLPAQLLPQQH